MMVEGVGSKVCFHPYPMSQGWEGERQREHNKRGNYIMKRKLRFKGGRETNKKKEKKLP